MACPALPTCGLAISESERVLPSVLDQLEKKIESLGLAGERIMIRMTGCPNGCARPYNAEIAFVGRTTGTYNVYVGGSLTGNRMNQVYAEKVLQKDLAQSVELLLDLYKKERSPGEHFGDFCHRLGVEKLKILLLSPER
jgi:sulfite reductase (ferredoxin)